MIAGHYPQFVVTKCPELVLNRLICCPVHPVVFEKWWLEMNSVQPLVLGLVSSDQVCLTSALGTLACDEQLEERPGHTMSNTYKITLVRGGSHCICLQSFTQLINSPDLIANF